MQKITIAIKSLEKSIAQIKNNGEREFSIDAFRGHAKRYAELTEIVLKHKKSKVLDIGASPYHLLYILKKLNIDTVGVDIDPKVLSSFCLVNKLKVYKCNVELENLPFKDNEFDIVILAEVFEHLGNNPLKVISEIYRVLKPGGRIILTTPNLYSLHKILMFNLGRGFNNAFTELNKVNLIGYMGHIREYSGREIKNILVKNNFIFESIKFKKYYDFFPKFRILDRILEVGMLVSEGLKPTQIVIAKKNG